MLTVDRVLGFSSDGTLYDTPSGSVFSAIILHAAIFRQRRQPLDKPPDIIACTHMRWNASYSPEGNFGRILR